MSRTLQHFLSKLNGGMCAFGGVCVCAEVELIVLNYCHDVAKR